jgi:hypothetical protein
VGRINGRVWIKEWEEGTKGGAFVGVHKQINLEFHDLGYCFVVEHTRGVVAHILEARHAFGEGVAGRMDA